MDGVIFVDYLVVILESTVEFYKFHTQSFSRKNHNLQLIILPEAETGQSPPLARNNVMPEVETGQSPPLAGKKVIPAAERLG